MIWTKLLLVDVLVSAAVSLYIRFSNPDATSTRLLIDYAGTWALMIASLFWLAILASHEEDRES